MKNNDTRVDRISLERDLTRDRQRLEAVKSTEKSLRPRLVSYRLDDRTVICTTAERLPELINAHQEKRNRI